MFPVMETMVVVIEYDGDNLFVSYVLVDFMNLFFFFLCQLCQVVKGSMLAEKNQKQVHLL